jgi:hypothetical protein
MYRKDKKVAVDIIIYFERGFKDVWYLVVPPGSEAILTTEEVVKIYRSRMQIEQGFRDWKTHLGVRGLKLKIDKDIRLTRLLFALSVAYLLLVLLGASSFGESLRPKFETKRTKPRHGTIKSLSVLTLGLYMLSASWRFPEIITQLKRIIRLLKKSSALSLVLKI